MMQGTNVATRVSNERSPRGRRLVYMPPRLAKCSLLWSVRLFVLLEILLPGRGVEGLILREDKANFKTGNLESMHFQRVKRTAGEEAETRSADERVAYRPPRLPLNLDSILSGDFFEDNTEFDAGLRLVDSSKSYMGRVEFPLSDRTWGTVCGDGWTLADATVVCRQMGFLTGGVIRRKSGAFGSGRGPVILSKVKCRGDENSIEDCPAVKWNGKESLPCSRYLKGASVVCGCPLDESPHMKTKCFLRAGYMIGRLSCHHSCTDGWKLSGSRVRTCISDQKWDGIAPHCFREGDQREVCLMKDEQRTPCNRGKVSDLHPTIPFLKMSATHAVEKSKCVLAGCCFDASADVRCSLPADSPCIPNPCQNGGQCQEVLDFSGQYECRCSDRFRGRHCEHTKDFLCGVQQENRLPNRRVRRVVGGQAVVAESWPWIVQIKRNGTHHCGGTLIHPEWVLTAAHCITRELKNLHLMTMVVSHAVQHSISEHAIALVRIGGYTNHTILRRDIALLKLKRPIQSSNHMDILCLPRYKSESPKNGTKCWVAGWGNSDVMNQANQRQNAFHQADIPIISKSDCQSKADYTNDYNLVTDDMICAGYEDGGVDTCNGDSGGPLMCDRTDGTWYVAGIVSWGYKCGDAGSPGVYTKVSHYLSWIYSVIYPT